MSSTDIPINADLDSASLYWTENGVTTTLGSHLPRKDLTNKLLRVLHDRTIKLPPKQPAVATGGQRNTTIFDQVKDMVLPPGSAITVVRTFDRQGTVLGDVPFPDSFTETDCIDFRPGKTFPRTCIFDKISMGDRGHAPSLSIGRGSMMQALEMVLKLAGKIPPHDHQCMSFTFRSVPLNDQREARRLLKESHHRDLSASLHSSWKEQSYRQLETQLADHPMHGSSWRNSKAKSQVQPHVPHQTTEPQQPVHFDPQQTHAPIQWHDPQPYEYAAQPWPSRFDSHTAADPMTTVLGYPSLYIPDHLPAFTATDTCAAAYDRAYRQGYGHGWDDGQTYRTGWQHVPGYLSSALGQSAPTPPDEQAEIRSLP